jgi:endonuclease YncB( thermonuclease family)
MIYLERDFAMFKKVMKFIFLSLVLSLFIACGGETTTESTTITMTSTTESTTIGYVLPDLSNKTRSEISGVLNDLGVDFSFQKETSTTIVENTFIRYEGFSIGDTINPEQSVVVVIATEDLILPDLTGQSQTEILSTLLNLGINFKIEIVSDNDVPDQTFSSYGDGLEANDTIPTSFQVTVYVGYNSETLPDLTDKLKNEIIGILEEKNIVFEFNYITDDLYPEDSFAGYEDRTIGDFYEEGTVTVNLYKNTFTENETSLVISKYVDGGDDTSNQAIEIYNPTNQTIDLSDYHLAIFVNGSLTANYIIPFEEVSLLSGETYVIANTDADVSILSSADLISEDLLFDGNDTIQLRYKNDTYIDSIYNIGNRNYIMDNEVYIRNGSVVSGNRDFSLNEWHAFVPGYTEVLGTHPIVIPEKIEFVFINRMFDDPLGGMTQVTLDRINDGDTAAFSPGFLSGERVRFLGVDTPETYPSVEDWGLEAKAYTTIILSNAIDIYIQSDPDLGYTETYGRHLGLVWVNLGETGLTIEIKNSDDVVVRTEHLSGWILLNYYLVLNGYSYNYYSSESELVFQDRYIYRWFQEAEKFAQQNGLGIHE